MLWKVVESVNCFERKYIGIVNILEYIDEFDNHDPVRDIYSFFRRAEIYCNMLSLTAATAWATLRCYCFCCYEDSLIILILRPTE